MNSPPPLLLLGLSLLLFLSLPTPSLAAERCNPNDKKVLLEIKKSFGNPYLLASWVSSNDCCDWYQVECDRTTNRIISLTIFAGNLSGQIPAAVGDLPYLQTLVFRKLSNLTGTIPSAIAKLTHLTLVRLSWTNLTGPVPAFFAQLKNLTFLDLSFNDLSGSIPPELGQLTNLGAIHLDRNKLTGQIPEWIFTGNVPDIYLSHNQLTGPIPKSFGYYNYTTLDFSRNMLSGDLSFLFGSNKTVQIVDFSRNKFEFNLSNVNFPASLTSLDLNHNKIFGSLPEELTTLNVAAGWTGVQRGHLAQEGPQVRGYSARNLRPGGGVFGRPKGSVAWVPGLGGTVTAWLREASGALGGGPRAPLGPSRLTSVPGMVSPGVVGAR